MPNLPRQEPDFGSEFEPMIAHQQMSTDTDAPARSGRPIDEPTESIGEYLSGKRQRTGKTLTDISRALKIAQHHLIAIENNSFEELPGRAYAIGFVRSYAIYLGLDARVLAARLKAELPEPDEGLPFAALDPIGRGDHPASPASASVENGDGREPKFAFLSAPEHIAPVFSASGRTLPLFPAPERTAPLPSTPARSMPLPPARSAPLPPTPARSIPLPPKRARGLPLPSLPDYPLRNWVTAGLMCVAMVYFGTSIIHSGLRGAPPAVTPVPARLAAEAGFTPDNVGPPPVATIGQPVRNPPEAVLAPPASPVSPAVAATARPAPVAREPAPDPAREAIPAQPDNTVDAARVFHAQLPLGQLYGEQNKNSRVTLRVHRPTLVAVLGNRNHAFIDRVLRAGDTYRVPNLRGMKLNVRDAGAVEVILDGNTIGFAGKDGVAERGLSLQPQSIISRYRSLQE